MFKLKIILIRIGYVLLYIVHIVALLLIGYLLNHFIEIMTMIPVFYAFTSKYEKQYHKETVIKCVLFTLMILTLICIFTMYGLTTISYYVRDYLDKKALLTKKLESMTYDEMKARFTNYTDYEIKAVYSYINRGEKLADHIAMKYNYSTRQLQRIIKKMKDELK